MVRKVKRERIPLVNLDPVREDIAEILSKGVDNYYKTFTIPKRSGGRRTICAPVFELKRVQRYINNQIARVWAPSIWSSGFVRGRGITHNAAKHRHMPGFLSNEWTTLDVVKEPSAQIVTRKVGNIRLVFCNVPELLESNRKFRFRPESMVRLDLRDAFGSTAKSNIRKAFPKKLGLSPEDIELVLEICTLDGALPQGAPTSPTLLNMALEPFDKYCIHLLTKKVATRFNVQLTYTRYADDITISSVVPNMAFKCISFVEQIAKTMGYEVKKKKTRLMTRGTGLFVNGINIVNGDTHLSVSRKVRSSIRSMIHNTAKSYPNCLSAEAITGKITYVYSLDPIHGMQLLRYAIDRGVLSRTQHISGKTIDDMELQYGTSVPERHQFYTQKKNVSSNSKYKESNTSQYSEQHSVGSV